MKKLLAGLVVLVAAMGFAQTAADVVLRVGGPVVGTQGGAQGVFSRLVDQQIICANVAGPVGALLASNASMDVDLFNMFVADVLNGRSCMADAQAARQYLATRGINVTSVSNAALASVLNSTSLSQTAGTSTNQATPRRP